MTFIIDPNRLKKIRAAYAEPFSQLADKLKWFQQIVFRGAAAGAVGCFGLLGASGVDPAVAQLIAWPLTLFALSLCVFVIGRSAEIGGDSSDLLKGVANDAPELVKDMPPWLKWLISGKSNLVSFHASTLFVSLVLLGAGFIWAVVAVWQIAA